MTSEETTAQLICELIEKARLLGIPEDMLFAEMLYRHYDQ